MWIEIGSDTPLNNWITIDLNKETDVSLDLFSSFPLNGNIVDKLYTSHILEHLHYNKLLEVLLELKKILKYGEELSIFVSNVKIFIKVCQKNDKNLKSYSIYVLAVK